MISSSEIEPLVHKCFYRQDGTFCRDGSLWEIVNGNLTGATPVRVFGDHVQCPACEGKSVLLTGRGRELLAFIDVFARPFLRDLIDELFEEREQH